MLKKLVNFCKTYKATIFASFIASIIVLILEFSWSLVSKFIMWLPFEFLNEKSVTKFLHLVIILDVVIIIILKLIKKKVSSITIPPFINITSNNHAEWCKSIAKTLTHRLSKIKGLNVVPFKPEVDYKKYKVDYILEGNLQSDGEGLNISVGLVDKAYNNYVGIGLYPIKEADTDSQKKITELIMSNIRPKLFPKKDPQHLAYNSDNLDAYLLFRTGWALWCKMTSKSLNQAIVYFKEAINKDPHYALAYSWLANSYIYLCHWGEINPREALSKANEAAKKAREIPAAHPREAPGL